MEQKKRMRPTVAQVKELEFKNKELEMELEFVRNLCLFDRIFRWKKILGKL